MAQRKGPPTATRNCNATRPEFKASVNLKLKSAHQNGPNWWSTVYSLTTRNTICVPLSSFTFFPVEVTTEPCVASAAAAFNV